MSLRTKQLRDPSKAPRQLVDEVQYRLVQRGTAPAGSSYGIPFRGDAGRSDVDNSLARIPGIAGIETNDPTG